MLMFTFDFTAFHRKTRPIVQFFKFLNSEDLKDSVSIVRSNPKTLVVLDGPYVCLLFSQSMGVMICSSTKERKRTENPLTFQHNLSQMFAFHISFWMIVHMKQLLQEPVINCSQGCKLTFWLTCQGDR